MKHHETMFHDVDSYKKHPRNLSFSLQKIKYYKTT